MFILTILITFLIDIVSWHSLASKFSRVNLDSQQQKLVSNASKFANR